MQTKRWRTHCEHLYVNWACFSFTLFTCTEQLPNKHQPLWILGLWKATKSCLAVNKPNFFSRFKYYKMALTRWWFAFLKKKNFFVFVSLESSAFCVVCECHHFVPDLNISATIWWITMNFTDMHDPQRTVPPAPPWGCLLWFWWNI